MVHKGSIWLDRISTSYGTQPNHEEIKQEGIKIWTPKKLFQEVFRAIVDWVPTHKSKSEQATLLECWWMLKLLESLREWELLNIESTD